MALRWHRDAVQILGQHDRPAERRRRLAGEPLAVVMLVALREMGEHEQPRPGLGRDAAGLAGGQVPVLAGQPGLGVQDSRYREIFYAGLGRDLTS